MSSQGVYLVHREVEACVGLDMAQQGIDLGAEHVQASATTLAERLQLLHSAAEP